MTFLSEAEHVALVLAGFGLGTAVAVAACFYAVRYLLREHQAEEKLWLEARDNDSAKREQAMIRAVEESRRYPAQVANIYGPISTSMGKMEKQLAALIQKMSAAETLVRRVEDLALQLDRFRERLEALETWRQADAAREDRHGE